MVQLLGGGRCGYEAPDDPRLLPRACEHLGCAVVEASC